MAKRAQFSAKPQCRYPLHPEKRVAVTDHCEGSLPSAVTVQQRPRIDPGTQINRPKALENIQASGGGKEFEPDTGGTLPKGDEYPNAPLACV